MPGSSPLSKGLSAAELERLSPFMAAAVGIALGGAESRRDRVDLTPEATPTTVRASKAALLGAGAAAFVVVSGGFIFLRQGQEISSAKAERALVEQKVTDARARVAERAAIKAPDLGTSLSALYASSRATDADWATVAEQLDGLGEPLGVAITSVNGVANPTATPVAPATATVTTTPGTGTPAAATAPTGQTEPTTPASPDLVPNADLATASLNGHRAGPRSHRGVDRRRQRQPPLRHRMGGHHHQGRTAGRLRPAPVHGPDSDHQGQPRPPQPPGGPASMKSNRSSMVKPLILLGVLVLGLAYLVAWRPRAAQMSDIHRERDTMQEELVGLRAALAAKQPDADPTTQALAVALPAQAQLPELLRQLQAIATETGVDQKAVGPAAPAASAGATGSSVQLVISTTGARPAVYSYLHQLGALPRMLVVDKLTLSKPAADPTSPSPAGDVLTADITARVFTTAAAAVPAS